MAYDLPRAALCLRMARVPHQAVPALTPARQTARHSTHREMSWTPQTSLPQTTPIVSLVWAPLLPHRCSPFPATPGLMQTTYILDHPLPHPPRLHFKIPHPPPLQTMW